MAHRPIVLLLEDDDANASGYLQPLAGGELWTARPIAPGAAPAPCATQWLRSAGGPPISDPEWSVIYDGPGLVDGALRTIRASLSTQGERRVDFEDGESFFLDAHGEVVRRRGSDPVTTRSLERALGAPLALAFAIRGVHLLHASAVTRRDAAGESAGAIAFTAESGAGKSTLAAAALPDSPPEVAGFVRIADDMLPVRLERPARALPHFPQLKLADAEVYPATAPPALRLEHLFEIDHSSDVDAIEIERLTPAAACLAIARATVAAKLFDPALLRRHFELCAAAGEELPVHRLRYPSGRERLPEVLAAIARVPAPV